MEMKIVITGDGDADADDEQVVDHALTAWNPSTRYITMLIVTDVMRMVRITMMMVIGDIGCRYQVGLDAHILSCLLPFVPDAVFDGISTMVFQFFNLPIMDVIYRSHETPRPHHD